MKPLILGHDRRFYVLILYYAFSLYLLLFLWGCGNGINLDKMEHIPLSSPVDIVFKRSVAAALDEDNQIWQWNFDKNNEITRLTKVKIPNARYFLLNSHLSIGWAVNVNGKVFTWSLFAPTLIEPYETQKPVSKIVSLGMNHVFLYTDGTVTGTGGVTSSGFGAPKNTNDKIDYASLSIIKDIFWKGDYLVAITREGEVIGACGDGLDNLIISQKPTNDGTPVKIKGLNRIKRFYQYGRFYYAIGENDEIHYWNGSFTKKGIQTLDVKGSNLAYDRVLTRDGTNYKLIDSNITGSNLSSAGSENLDLPEGYGIWYLGYYSKKAVGLDVEGRLWLYDYRASAKEGSRISNASQIGDFKVKLDYYKN